MKTSKRGAQKAPKKKDGRRALALAPSWPLRWDSYPDDNQNTVLEAVGGSTDGESNDLYYRIKQEVRCNMHVWVEASSPELMIDEESPLTWPKKHAARRRIQSHHDAIMRDYLFSANASGETRRGE